jgi:hypothetical protein
MLLLLSVLLGFLILTLLYYKTYFIRRIFNNIIGKRYKSEITFVDNFEDMEKILENNGLYRLSPDNKKTLVLFDIDETLITTKNKLLRPMSGDTIDDLLSNLFPTELEKELQYSHVVTHTKTILVNDKIPAFIKRLQNANMKVLGITRMIPGAGKCGIIESMEDHRRKDLLEKGIDFANTFLSHPILFDFQTKNNRKPLYKDGIIYALPYNKGEVLIKLLKYMSSMKIEISKIYFVDDSKHQIESVFKTCDKIGIECLCLHYVDRNINNESLNEIINHLMNDSIN